MASDHIRLDYFFDPFCGWCYASAPALKAVAEHFGDALHLQPSGLFTGTRPVSSIADHAYRNDTRIAELTGQPFTDAYHHGVMRAPGGVFTSMPATRALVALGEIDAALEPRFLHAVQVARYVDGRDTSQPDVVAAVARELVGAGLDAAAFGERLRSDAALISTTDARIGRTQQAMQALSTSGVPQLLVTRGDDRRIVHGQDLYAGGDHLIGLLNSFAGR